MAIGKRDKKRPGPSKRIRTSLSSGPSRPLAIGCPKQPAGCLRSDHLAGYYRNNSRNTSFLKLDFPAASKCQRWTPLQASSQSRFASNVNTKGMVAKSREKTSSLFGRNSLDGRKSLEFAASTKRVRHDAPDFAKNRKRHAGGRRVGESECKATLATDWVTKATILIIYVDAR